MRVLKLYPADHFGNLEQMSETGGPVRDGETSVVAGDQCTGNDEDKSRERRKNCEIMMRPVEGRGQRTFQVRVSLFPHITTRCDAQPTMVSPWEALGASGLGRQVPTSDRNGRTTRTLLGLKGEGGLLCFFRSDCNSHCLLA